MDCYNPAAQKAKVLNAEYDRLKSELDEVSKNILAQDPNEVVLLSLLRSRKDKISTDFETAKLLLKTYEEDRKDRTDDYVREVARAESNMRLCTEEIMRTNDVATRLEYLGAKQRQLEKKEDAEKQLEVISAKKTAWVLEDLKSDEDVKLRMKLQSNDHNEARRFIKRQKINQDYQTAVTAEYGSRHFDNWDLHAEKPSPSKKTFRKFPCQYLNCTWVGTYSRDRKEHERICRHR